MKVPKYRLHKSTNRAMVTLNGRDYYIGVYDSPESRAKYARMIADYIEQGRSYNVSPSQVTVAMVMAEYLKHCDVHYPAGLASETTRIEHALRYLEPYENDLASEFGPLRLAAVRSAMLEATGEVSKKPHSRQYINKMIDRIRRMFGWAVSRELVSESVYRALLTMRGLSVGRSSAPEAKPVKPVTNAQVELTLPHCTSVVAAMIKLQRLTGMRPGEVVKLTPSQLDRSADVWVYMPEKHKTAWRGSTRSIFIGPLAQELLKPFLSRGDNECCFSPYESDVERRAKLAAKRVTPPKQGNRAGTNKKRKPLRSPGDSYTTQSYGKAVIYACEQAWPMPKGLERPERSKWRATYWWSPNQLRHEAATRIRRDHGLDAAQLILGHSHASTTEIYAEIDDTRARHIAATSG